MLRIALVTLVCHATTLLDLNYSGNQQFLQSSLDMIYTDMSQGQANITRDLFVSYYTNATNQLNDSTVFTGFPMQKASKKTIKQLWQLMADDDQDSMTRQQYSGIYQFVYSRQFFHNDSSCTDTSNHIRDLCQDREGAYSMNDIGQQINEVAYQCKKGFGGLSFYVTETCVLKATTCKEISTCFGKKKLQKRNKVIGQRYVAWMQMAKRRMEIQPTDQICSTNYQHKFDQELEHSSRARVSKVMSSYEKCLHNSTSLITELTTNTSCSTACQSLVKRQWQIIPAVAFMIWTVMFASVGYTITTILVVFALLLAASPIIINSVKYKEFSASTADQMARLNDTVILTPQGQPEQIFYWSQCGIPGSKEAQDCNFGGQLYRNDSCTSLYKYTEGSAMCTGNIPVDNQTVSTNKKAQYDFFTAWRFQCHSLCVKNK